MEATTRMHATVSQERPRGVFALARTQGLLSSVDAVDLAVRMIPHFLASQKRWSVTLTAAAFAGLLPENHKRTTFCFARD
jgi:hypothetical protein